LKKLIIKLVFKKKNANFFAKNWEKSPKIVIITSTPGETRHFVRKGRVKVQDLIQVRIVRRVLGLGGATDFRQFLVVVQEWARPGLDVIDDVGLIRQPKKGTCKTMD
jgi:hypothetical protein